MTALARFFAAVVALFALAVIAIVATVETFVRGNAVLRDLEE